MISVIIPTYKEPEYLDLCIESILSGQKYKNEIVVVVPTVETFVNCGK